MHSSVSFVKSGYDIDLLRGYVASFCSSMDLVVSPAGTLLNVSWKYPGNLLGWICRQPAKERGVKCRVVVCEHAAQNVPDGMADRQTDRQTDTIHPLYDDNSAS